MSAIIAATTVGTAFNIYSGITQGKAAKNAENAQAASLAANQGIASQVKLQEDQLGYTPLKKQEQEDQSLGLTPQGQMAMDRFKADMAQSNAQIAAQAPTVGSGVSGARSLTNQFRQAQGVASINLEDLAGKKSNLRSDIAMGVQTPGWSNIATGANTQQANFQGQMAQQANQRQQSAYGAAATGLLGLASAYAGMGTDTDLDTDGNPPQASNTNLDTNSINQTPGLIPQRQQIVLPGSVDPNDQLPFALPR